MTLKRNLDNRSGACFDVGGNQGTWRKPTQAQGEHANSTQIGPVPGGFQTQMADCINLRNENC